MAEQKDAQQQDLYKPTSVFLTGGAGFIGSHVLALLVNKYPDVKFVCFDKLDYCATTKNFAAIADAPNFKFVKGDITSADFVAHVFKTEKIDTVMHFAAQSHVDNSFGNSFQFTLTNVYGTHVLLEAAKAIGPQLRRFIHVSTDEVYGESTLEHDDEWFNEKSALKPTNPYAATKAAAELLANAYHSSFKMPIIITRGNNVYGPHQYPEKLIPKFILRLEAGQKLCLHGDGSHRRSFIYVSDVARAFDTVLHYGKIGETYNIGTSFEISNLEVSKTLLKQYGFESEEEKWIEFVKDREFNDRRYHIDNTKLLELNWKPEIEWEEGIKKTIDWYRSHPGYFGDVSDVLVPHPRVGVGVGAHAAIEGAENTEVGK